MTRTDFSILESQRITRSMLRRPLSAPAERVEVDHDLTTMRFSRTLDERRPTERSSQAWIEPMRDDPPLDHGDKVVIWGAAIATAAVVAFYFIGWVTL